jgi:NTE family protein
MSTAQDRCRSKTAFVFAGGGSHGAIQVGMLKALAAHGVKADFVVGASVGAMNAAYFAGRPTQDGISNLERIWRRLRRRDVFPVSWRSLWNFARYGDFPVSSEGLRALCRAHLPYRDLSEAALPVHVVATDVLSGEAVVISEGPAEDAVVASAAIPAAFAPVKVNSRYLADGAITSNTPIKAAVALGARRLIVLSTGHPGLLEAPPRGAMAMAMHALTLILARQTEIELQGLDRRIERFLVPSPGPVRGSPYDFSQTGNLIDKAAEAAGRWLADGGLERRPPVGVPSRPRRSDQPLGWAHAMA